MHRETQIATALEQPSNLLALFYFLLSSMNHSEMRKQELIDAFIH